MTTPLETQTRQERGWIYITSCIILVVLAVAALVAFRNVREDKKAQDKADQLIAAIEDTGATAPSKDQIVRVLGDNGGATCEDPNAALNRAVLLSQLTNGSGGPGSRPVIADTKVFQGQLMIIKVYCPDELEDFQKFVEDLDTNADVAGD